MWVERIVKCDEGGKSERELVAGVGGCGWVVVHRVVPSVYIVWHCDVVSNTKFFNFLNKLYVYMHQHTATSTTHTFQLPIHHQVQHKHTIKKT